MMKKIDYYEEILLNLSSDDIKEVYDSCLDVTLKDDTEDYLLNAACTLLQPENVIFFISKGADLNSVGRALDTPLINAIDHWEANPTAALKIVEILIKSGADLEERGMFDKTPFIKACTRGCIDIIKFLVASGCNIHATTKDFGIEENGLDYAYLMHANQECIKYLKSLYKKA